MPVTYRSTATRICISTECALLLVLYWFRRRVGKRLYRSYRYPVPPTTNPILMHQVRCRGNETSLAECHHSGWGVHDCTHIEDVLLTCVKSRFHFFQFPNVVVCACKKFHPGILQASPWAYFSTCREL